MTRRQLASILGGEISVGSLVVEWWKSLMDHSPKARNMIFTKGVDNGQLPSYMGIKISHDMRILDWRSRTLRCVCFSTLLSSSMIPSQNGGMAIFWALMRTSGLMNFFQTKWDRNRRINWVPWYRGHGSMSCWGFQKSSKLFFSEITLAVHVGMNKKSWTVGIRGPLQYLQWVPECQITDSQAFLRKSHFSSWRGNPPWVLRMRLGMEIELSQLSVGWRRLEDYRKAISSIANFITAIPVNGSASQQTLLIIEKVWDLRHLNDRFRT